LLGESEIVSNRDKFTALSKEYSELEPIIERHRRIGSMRAQLDDAQALLEDDDAEMRQLASDDRDQPRAHRSAELEIKALLVPKDPHDDANVFFEIRAGTGGDEAAIRGRPS
jgi:peptide chain release factor 1